MTDLKISRSEEETLDIAAALARKLTPGTVVALTGDLGAGKTVFVRGVAAALGVTGPVTSPTFTLIQEYRGAVTLYHMDLYRLNRPEEMVAIGVEDYFYGDGICLVEWAEKLGELLPGDAVRITIRHRDDQRREIEIQIPPSERGIP
jgi:tRNA threonylcarbamoyladenosine biosynthesis protein TsaE